LGSHLWLCFNFWYLFSVWSLKNFLFLRWWYLNDVMLVDWSKGSRNPQFALSCLVWLSFFSLFATEGLQFFQYFTHSFLQAQLPKVQKDTDDLTVFLRLWDLCELKLLANMLVKSTQGLQFLHYFTHSFLRGQLPKVQKDTVGEIDPRA